MNDCTCVKEMLLKNFVYTDAQRERKWIIKREWWGRRRQKGIEDGDKEKKGKKGKKTGRCVFLWGATERIVFSLSPSLAPARSLRGSLGYWGKTSQPPSPLNPALGCLPWPGCLTALLMLHTGTQGPWVREGEGAGVQGEEGREEENGIDEEWKSDEDGGRVRRIEDGVEEEWHQVEVKTKDCSERCEGARVLAYSDLNHHDQIHLGRSPEERAVQRATECTLSTHREEILPAKSLHKKSKH